MIKTLIFLTFTLQLTSAATHSLQYFQTTVTPGNSLPEFSSVGQVDEEQTGYYESSSRTLFVKTDLLKPSDYEEDWVLMMMLIAANENKMTRSILAYLMKVFNQTGELHTLQKMVGCELDDDGSRRGYAQYGYDGEDLLTLDLNSGTWIAAVPQILPLIQTGSTQDLEHFIHNECIDWLQKYVKYGKPVLERKDPPEVSLFQKDSSSPVVCHATGFFPKAVMISWQKNREELHGDQDLRETTPNGDGTFQKRSILTIPPKELDSDEYTCVIQHSSLEKEMVLKVSNRRVLSGVPVGVIIGAVVAVLLLIVIGCVGVFIWKKKTGFKPVSQNPSEADSSSNNSSK